MSMSRSLSFVTPCERIGGMSVLFKCTTVVFKLCVVHASIHQKCVHIVDWKPISVVWFPARFIVCFG